MRESYPQQAGNYRRKTTANWARQGWEYSLENGQLTLRLPLPMLEILASTADALEQIAGQACLVVAKALLDDEVERRAGPRYARRGPGPYRWGQQQGHLVFGGQKLPLRRPRLRQDGKETELESYALLSAARRLQAPVLSLILAGLSTRNYERAVDGFVESYGIQRSSVSRHFVAASARQLAELCERPLGELKLVAIVLDGKEYTQGTVIVGLGLDEGGHKHVLGLWDGATENAVVVQALLGDLERRGLDMQRRYLFVLDGSKALAKAVRAKFGAGALIQRCQLHKRRNVKAHLPEKWQGQAEQRLKVAYGMRQYEEARQELGKTVEWLRTIHEGAARSLEEGLEETLTLHKLGVPELLRKTLSSTNVIESCFSHVQHQARNVKRWRNAEMVRRWTGAALLAAEKKFRRIRGHKSLPLLLQALCPQSAVAVGSIGGYSGGASAPASNFN